MIKFLTGLLIGAAITPVALLLGIAITHAVAADVTVPFSLPLGTTTGLPLGTYLNAGVSPENMMAPIRVDKDGYVICSTERKP